LRSHKLAITQQALGLRLIEKGDTVEGRKFLQTSTQVLGSDKKIMFGIMLSYLPISLRKLVLQVFRQIRPRDYTEQVRLRI
jgi:hypothetical protein